MTYMDRSQSPLGRSKTAGLDFVLGKAVATGHNNRWVQVRKFDIADFIPPAV